MDDFGFKFKIGELVQIQILPIVIKMKKDDRLSWLSAKTEIGKFRIVERILQECPGGIQRIYVVRSISETGHIGADYIKLNEIEIKPYEPEMEIPKEAVK